MSYSALAVKWTFLEPRDSHRGRCCTIITSILGLSIEFNAVLSAFSTLGSSTTSIASRIRITEGTRAALSYTFTLCDSDDAISEWHRSMIGPKNISPM